MKLTRRLPWPLAILLLVICLPLRAGDLFYLGKKNSRCAKAVGQPELPRND
jgi:hypothetical protein